MEQQARDVGWQESELWHRRALATLTIGIVAVHFIGISLTTGHDGPMVQGDARSYFAYLPSIMLDQDLDLQNQFSVLKPEGDSGYPFGVGQHNRAINPFPIGPALLWLPGYTVGLGVDMLRAPGPAEAPLGYGAGVVLATVGWCLLLVGVGAETSRRLAGSMIGARQAFPATVMAWLATPALYYTVITPLYSHAIAWFATSLMLWLTWCCSRKPDRTSLWLAAGLSAGLVIAIRLQDAPLLFVPLATLAGCIGTCGLYVLFRRTIMWSVGMILGFSAQGLTSLLIQGELLPPGGIAALSVPSFAELGAILFSLGYRGWISWSPIILPGLVGLVVLARRAQAPETRRFIWASLASIVGMLMIDLVHPFGEGASFGGRRYVSVTPLIGLGLATLLAPLAGRRTNAVAWLLLPVLTIWGLWTLGSYELLVIRHGLYPTLLQTLQHAVGLGTF